MLAPQPIAVPYEHLTLRQKKQQQHYELIEAIRDNMYRGDVVGVAYENGFSIEACQNVMRGRTKNPKIIKALFERALQNRKDFGASTQLMINQLIQ